ncbi:MAG: nickel pincer cofactor biosynthesis protein LarC [Oscillospiraceae bacterium]|nr:nickel pincer cofactor biosynthesis protein LarC [Oscillospiraceae bacterium]
MLYFDCVSGISGDMTVAALTDLGVPPEVVRQALAALPVDGYELGWGKTVKNGIQATAFTVTDTRAARRGTADGASAHQAHCSMNDIEAILHLSSLTPPVRQTALTVFRIIAEAEAKIHGVPVGEVHFHEVGAIDSIVDIVAAAQCIDHLAPDRIVFSQLREGQGTVRTQHGILPVPTPATLAILQACGAPIAFTDAVGEMITPTGAGLAAALGETFGAPCPAGRVLSVGYGAGQKDFDHPNILRAVLVDTEEDATRDTVCVLEATLDDCTGETLGHALEVLRDNDMPECYFTPITMKKGRPGVLLTVLCPPDMESRAAELIFRHTTTIGLRRSLVGRYVMARELVTVRTPYGEVPMKVSRIGDITQVKPEFEAVRDCARKVGVPLDTVRRAALAVFDGVPETQGYIRLLRKDEKEGKDDGGSKHEGEFDETTERA